MCDSWLRTLLTEREQITLKNLENLAKKTVLAGGASRLRNYTLHQEVHWRNIEEICSFILKKYKDNKNNDILTEQGEVFLLLASIFFHDITMFKEYTDEELKEHAQLYGLKDPLINLSDIQRNLHNDEVGSVLSELWSKLENCGLDSSYVPLISEICKLHRSYDLENWPQKLVRKVAVILRIADELDIGSSRAELTTFFLKYKNFDTTSLRHWVKHIVTHNWRDGSTVLYKHNNNSVTFLVSCTPPDNKFIPFIYNQVLKRINKELEDAKLRELLTNIWNISIYIEPDTRELTRKEFLNQETTNIMLDTLERWAGEENVILGNKPYSEMLRKELETCSNLYCRASDDVRIHMTARRHHDRIREKITEVYWQVFGPVAGGKKKFRNPSKYMVTSYSSKRFHEYYAKCLSWINQTSFSC